YRAHYAPSNATLAITGGFDPEVAKALVERYFGSLPPGQPATRVKVDVPRLASNRLVVREERVGVPKLTLVWHAPPYFAPDEAPLETVAALLGDGLNARLYKRLVREEKLASKLAAFVAPAEVSGLFYV